MATVFDGPGDRAIDVVFRTRGEPVSYTAVGVGAGITVATVRREAVAVSDLGAGFLQAHEPITVLQFRISELTAAGLDPPAVGDHVLFGNGQAYIVDKPADIDGRRYRVVVKAAT